MRQLYLHLKGYYCAHLQSEHNNDFTLCSAKEEFCKMKVNFTGSGPSFSRLAP